MDSKEFKTVFGEVAKANDFKKHLGVGIKKALSVSLYLNYKNQTLEIIINFL